MDTAIQHDLVGRINGASAEFDRLNLVDVHRLTDQPLLTPDRRILRISSSSSCIIRRPPEA
jgi:hypothetical protein